MTAQSKVNCEYTVYVCVLCVWCVDCMHVYVYIYIYIYIINAFYLFIFIKNIVIRNVSNKHVRMISERSRGHWRTGVIAAENSPLPSSLYSILRYFK